MKRFLFLILVLHLVAACAPRAGLQKPEDLLAYLPLTGEKSLLSRHAPVFVIQEADKPYNRIGIPRAELSGKGEEIIHVDPATAVIYAEQRTFATSRDTYENLIYRVHFAKTPFELIPFQIAAGKNVGIFVIITLNSSNQPVLYTTVHTCGCYLAFIPTSHLPADAFPADWPAGEQTVYAQTLPALLELPETGPLPPVHILLKDASHRIMHVWLPGESFARALQKDHITFQSLQSLEYLPLINTRQTTSFFVQEGGRQGHVKGSHKPLERLLMSWWAFDWHIGEDKRLGRDTSEPPVFFTSLKLWARDESDMRDFPRFLQYWGWDL